MSNAEGVGNLTISRHVGESIRVGDDVVVTVKRTQAGRVSLTITAPKNVRVERVDR